MTADGGVAAAHFASSDFPVESRHEIFSQITPGYDIILPVGTTADGLFFDCSGWLLDDLALTSNQLSAMELARTPAHIRDYERDTYTFILAQRGRWWAKLDYGDIHVGSGQVCIMDFTVPWHVYGTAQQNVMLVVPRSVVEATAPAAPRLHGKLLEGASGRLFAEHMVALARHMPSAGRGDVPLIRDATVALLASALAALPADSSDEPERGSRTTSMVRIHAFIDDNLAVDDLSAERISREMAVTRSTLYRAFARWGGVENYIQRRRLEAAHSRLSDANVRSTMAEIADEFCFSSPSHFSTAFRRRFGYTPRDVRGSTRRVIGTSELFDIWLDAQRGAS